MNAQNFYISNGVYFCEVSNLFVILDSRNDKYFLLDSEKSTRFREILAQLNKFGQPSDPFFTWLLNSKYFTEDKQNGRPLENTSHISPVGSLFGIESKHRPNLTFSDAVNFFISYATAMRLRRSMSLEKIIKTVEGWKKRSPSKTPRKHELTPECALELARRFYSISPFFITGKDQCFLKSLMLMDFLRRQGVYGRWEFGVRIAPFSAHCWVEHGQIVLNDSIDHVSEYQKIMSI